MPSQPVRLYEDEKREREKYYIKKNCDADKYRRMAG